MDENKIILETLSNLECVLFYASKDNQLKPEIDELRTEVKYMLERWHFLTGATL